MISKTTLLAIRVLNFLGRQPGNSVLSQRKMAEALQESPTYLAKVTRELVRAGILRAEKGARGGVHISRAPNEITLLQIVEACQGAIVGDYCSPDCDRRSVCSYHRAAEELHLAMVRVLSRWTMARLMERPSSNRVTPPGGSFCRMTGGQSAMDTAMR
jgi:Rrf2 family protein